MEQKKSKKFFNWIYGKLKNLSFFSIFSLLFYEIIEECIEEFIAWELSKATVFAINAVFSITLTQTIKILIKRLIKTITYKKGGDKMKKFKDVFEWIFKTNPKTSFGSFSAIGASVGSGTFIGFLLKLYAGLPDGASILVGIIAGVILLIFNELGIHGRGIETKTQKIEADAEKMKQKDVKEQIKIAKALEKQQDAENNAKIQQAKDAELLAKYQQYKAQGLIK